MNKKEMRAEATELLLSGMKKQDVFNTLYAQGFKNQPALASYIAGYVNPQRRAWNKWHIRAIVTWSMFQLIILHEFYTELGQEISLDFALIVSSVKGLVQCACLLGCVENKIWAYNFFFVWSAILIFIMLIPGVSEPGDFWWDLGYILALTAYVAFVRRRLFPSIVFFSPRKVNGAYALID